MANTKPQQLLGESWPAVDWARLDTCLMVAGGGLVAPTKT